MIKKLKWRRAAFEVHLENGPNMVAGFVSGNLGIRDIGRYRPIWAVTHVPTGLSITPGRAGFGKFDTAKAFAQRLACLTDWTHLDEKAENRDLQLQVVAIWNELIALDTFKMVADHYEQYENQGAVSRILPLQGTWRSPTLPRREKAAADAP